MDMDMDFSQEDFERLMLCEHTRKTAEDTYAQNPLDSDNLTQWGSALIQLSQFHSVSESKQMIKDGISKLEESLSINPDEDKTLWALGNAHTSQAFMITDADQAKPDFEKAAEYFQRAAEKDPTNELYQKSLEVSAKATELHKEIHQHGLSQQTMTMGGGSSASSKAKTSKKKKSSDFKYDVCGWIILAVGLIAWVGMAKSNSPPPSLR